MTLSLWNRRILLAAIGILSGTTLALEICLTNVFGVLLAYDYVSVVISIAIFGTGVGAFLAYRLERRLDPRAMLKRMGVLSLTSTVYMTLLAFAIARFPFVGQMWVYMMVALVPFLLTGGCVGIAFRLMREQTAVLYGVQLTGDALGVLASLFVLNHFGGIKSLFVYAILMALVTLAVLLMGRPFNTDERIVKSASHHKRPSTKASRSVKWQNGAAGIVLLLSFCADVFFLSPGFSLDLDYASMRGASPGKTLVQFLQQNPGSRVAYTQWDALARTDVVQTTDPTKDMIFEDGGAGSYMYKFNGKLPSIQSLAYDYEFLPFVMGPSEPSLVLGSGGGRDVLYSLLAGSRHVTAVELNPGVVNSVQHFSAFNGNLLHRPGVNVIVGDGRNTVERSNKQYGLISLDLVYSQVSDIRNLSLTENYIFTKEAFQSYLKHLLPSGRLIVISHNGIEGIRAFYTGLKALMDNSGLSPSEAGEHVALLMAPADSKEPGLTLSIISKQPIPSNQIQVIQMAEQSLGLQSLFLPGVAETYLKPLLDGKLSFEQFVHDGNYAVYPTTDDRPFFFQLSPGLPGSVWAWFAAIAALTLVVLGYAKVTQRKEREPGDKASFQWKHGIYFALLGVGYMCVQLPLIEKVLLVLWNPVLTTSVVLTAMLLGGGVGSFLSHRFRISLLSSVIAIVVLLVLEICFLPHLLQLALSMTLPVSVIFVGLIVCLTGVILGIPFPLGLRAVEETSSGSSAMYYAVNGVMSVWGSWIATVASTLWGFNIALLLGCVTYGLLYVVKREVRQLKQVKTRVQNREVIS